jgi:hypothetical protein
VIRTASRFPTPKGLAYPMGAEALSAALSRVPQQDELSVTFYFDGRAQAIVDAAKRGDSLPVLEVVYISGRADVIGAHAQGTPEWELWVRPVPSIHRSVARRSLLETGLPKVREWLSEARSATWRSERHRLQLHIRLPDSTIELEES